MADEVKPQNHSGKNGVVRDEKGRLVKGTAGNNPNGRRSLRQELLDETDGGMEVYEFWLNCMRNTLPGQEVRVKERQVAGHWLADRIWGKAVETTILLGLESGAAVASQLQPPELVALAQSYSGLIAAKSAAPAPKPVDIIDVTPEPKK
jgi:hypothetical protein